MARKLPWAQNGVATSRPLIKRETPTPRRPTNTAKEGPATPARGRARSPPQTPSSRHRNHSTSPPPGPPTVEPMIEGLHADDIYMIVEDELQAVAQTFTAHLHHAEYKRLVKRAREAPPKALLVPDSPMTKHTRKRLERDLLHDGQQRALQDIGVGQKSGVREENVEDPWRGTSLAGLIASGSQEKRSLKGLDRLPSATRAAQGYSRPQEAEDHVSEDEVYEQPRKRVKTGNEDRNKPVKSKGLDRIPSATNGLRGYSQPQEADDDAAEERLYETPRKRVKMRNGELHKQKKPRSEHGRAQTSSTPDSEERLTPASEHGRGGTSRRVEQQPPVDDAKKAAKDRLTAKLLARRKKEKKEESIEDRLAQVPMFLI